jgi:hypothetical protein
MAIYLRCGVFLRVKWLKWLREAGEGNSGDSTQGLLIFLFVPLGKGDPSRVILSLVLAHQMGVSAKGREVPA